MTAPGSASAAVLLLGGLLLAACAQRPGGPSSAPAEPEVVLMVDANGPWRQMPVPDDGEGTAPPAAPDPCPPAPAHVPVPRPGLHAPARPRLSVPRRRVTPEPTALGAPPPKSARDLGRERYLDHPTRIRADRITFYCPKEYVPEARMKGDDVRQTRPGRRVASGRARLTCRELTLEADQIILRVREEADANLQITARGNASFVTDQRGQVFREEGVRSLILTNEKLVPLR